MSSIGIEGLSIYSPGQQFLLTTLSELRGHASGYFTKSSGHISMAIPMMHEDVVTMAAEACSKLPCSLDDVTLVLFATESSKDQSKAQGIYLHRLLQLRPDCRVIELKQACYSATAGIQLAIAHVMRHPKEKVLVVASDIAFYEPYTVAEGSQGAGATAILISQNAKIATLSDHAGFVTEDHMDFWRPNHLPYPRVDGRLSCDLYIRLLHQCWQQYSQKSGLDYHDHQGFCFHTPLKKLALNAHRKLLLKQKITPDETMQQRIETSFLYATHIGNTYSASLMMSFASLLKHCHDDLAGQRIAMYSYGSGCVAECFHLQPITGYQQHLSHLPSIEALEQRPTLSQDSYLSLIAHNKSNDYSSAHSLKSEAHISEKQENGAVSSFTAQDKTQAPTSTFSLQGHVNDAPQYEQQS